MDEHEDLGHWLRQGLRPRQTPAGFTARLMARVPEALPVRSLQKKRTFWVPAAGWATAVVLLGIAGGSYLQHEQQQRVAGERARAQLFLALRMSAATLNDVQHKVLRSTTGDSE